jgi:CTP synthase
MQCAAIEYARNVLGWEGAHSTEFEPEAKTPVIDLMESQKAMENKGGTMRLGTYKCEIRSGTLAEQVYQQKAVEERHRHRYELNNAYTDTLAEGGLQFSGVNPDTNLVEMLELPTHGWFIGVQFHPEYRSTALRPHPLFVSFVEAGKAYKERLKQGLMVE